MTDTELADELIKRLNDIIKDPDVRKDVRSLMRLRVPASAATEEHPTIQASAGLGFLGFLNGLVGVIPGPRKYAGWGYVAAQVDEKTDELISFKRTDK